MLLPLKMCVNFLLRTHSDYEQQLRITNQEYEQQTHITNQDGGDRVLARRRDLVDSAIQMMVADEFYDCKPWVDLSELELMQGLKTFVCCGR